MKILFLAANPQSTSRLKLDTELREIDEALKMSRRSNEFELIQKWDVRPKDFRRALLDYEPDIVHFSGHGVGETGLVVIDSGSSGEEKLVSGEALAGLFAECPNIKCVLLNACYSEVQAQALVKQVDYVIGMLDTIYDKAAIAFSIGFYDGLGYGRNIDKAFNLGKNAILWEYGASFGKTRSRKFIPVDFEHAESQESLPEHLKPILLKKHIDVSQVIPLAKNQNTQNSDTTLTKNSIQEYQTRITDYLADRLLDPIEQFQLAILAKELGISESQANSILQTELDKIEQAKKDYQTILRKTIEQGYYPFNSKIELGLKDIQKKLKLIDSEVEEISRPILEEARPRIQTTHLTQKEAIQETETNLPSSQTTTNHELWLTPSPTQFRREQSSTDRTPSAPRQTNTTIGGITRQRFLQWAGGGVGGLVAALVASQIFKQDPKTAPKLVTPSESTDRLTAISVDIPKYIAPTEGGNRFAGLPLWTVKFETLMVNVKGEVASRHTHQAKFFKEDLGNGIILEMVSIPAGEFLMGSPSHEKDRENDESPQHKVSVPAFFMGKFTVTQAQYQAVIKSNPSRFYGDLRPVEQVSWHDANKFCQKLSDKTGRNYRLPSEAEWEYACRAKTTTPFHFGGTLITSLANYRGDYTYQSEPKGEKRERTTKVGSFPANAFGLFDMHGNVWEWCLDNWHNNYEDAPSDGSAWLIENDSSRLLRGGSWNYSINGCRSADRAKNRADWDNDGVGFRVVCSSTRSLS